MVSSKIFAGHLKRVPAYVKESAILINSVYASIEKEIVHHGDICQKWVQSRLVNYFDYFFFGIYGS